MGVMEIVQGIFEISFHAYVEYACLVFQFYCDATVEPPCTVFFYLIFFLEVLYEVLVILFLLIFYAKVIYHQCEHDTVCVVPPQAKRDGSRCIFKWAQLFIEGCV